MYQFLRGTKNLECGLGPHHPLLNRLYSIHRGMLPYLLPDRIRYILVFWPLKAVICCGTVTTNRFLYFTIQGILTAPKLSLSSTSIIIFSHSDYRRLKNLQSFQNHLNNCCHPLHHRIQLPCLRVHCTTGSHH